MKLRNLGMDLVGSTEGAAVSAGRWMGFGHREESDQLAIESMHSVLRDLDIDGYIIVGEEKDESRHHGKDSSADEPYIQSGLDSGQRVGTGQGPELDMVLDAIDGRKPAGSRSLRCHIGGGCGPSSLDVGASSGGSLYG